MKISEHHIEQAILEWLTNQGWFAVKFKDQTATVNGKHVASSKFQVRGVSDIVAIKDGITIWFEVKTDSGIQSPWQAQFQDNVTAHGGLYAVVRSITDVKAYLVAINAM